MKNMSELLLKALNEANKSACIYKLGSVITNKNYRIISTGFNNSLKTHPVQASYAKRSGKPDNIYLHAEIHALVKCKSKPYAIFIMRKTKNGSGISKPCKICMLAIKESGIQKIIYQDRNKKFRILKILQENDSNDRFHFRTV